MTEVVDAAVTASFDRDIEISHIQPGVFGIQDESFVAGAALRPDMVSGLDVVGAPVAVFADASTLFVTGSEDTAGLTLVGSLLDSVVSNDERPVSVAAFCVNEGQWQEFALPAEVLNTDDWRLARRRWDSLRYGEQKDALQTVMEAQGRDVYVAGLELVRDPEGQVITYSTLTEGVPTLLPRTDTVSCVSDDGESEIRDFADVLAAAGSPAPIPDVTPERWEIS